MPSTPVFARLARLAAPFLLGLAACGATPPEPPQPAPVPDVPRAPPVPETPAVSAKSAAFEHGELVLSEPLRFGANDELLEGGAAALQELKDFLVARRDVTTLRVEVHVAEGDGAADAALAKTLARAALLRRELVAIGAPTERLLFVGFGASKPIADNATPAGKAENRRVQLFACELRGHAIGGMPLDGGGKVLE